MAERAPLWEYEPTDLSLITPFLALEFLTGLAELLEERGLDCEMLEDGRNRSENAPPQEDLKAPSIEELRKLVAIIPNPADWGWDEYVRFGYAVKAAGIDDEPAARDAYLEWTHRWESGANDPDLDIHNWESFKPPFRVGWSWLQEQARRLTDYEPLQELFEADPNAVPSPPALDPRLTALQEVNKTYAVVQVGSDVVILQELQHGDVVALLCQTAFRLKLGNRFVPSPTGRGRHQALPTAWLNWRERREYNQVVFKPGDFEVPPSEYNLWRGWAVEPSPLGSCDLFLKHLLDVVCLGNQEHYEWLLDWLAHLFQHPQEKLGVVVGLQGGQGAGKSIVGAALKRLLGRYQVIADKPDQVFGHFNGHLGQCLLLQAEEAFWGGNKAAAGSLKHLVTGEYLRIERKNIDSVEMRNFTRLLITTNEDRVWPISIDDRRLAIFEVSSDRVGDAQYFEAMIAELESGGAEKLLYILLTREIDTQRLRRPPRTAALEAQAAESMSAEEVWLHGLLSTGEIPGTVDERGCVRVHATHLYESYEASLPTRAHYKKNSKAFGKFVGDHLDTENVGRERVRNSSYKVVYSTVYNIPPLDEVRARYSRRGRGAEQKWDEPNQWVAADPFPDLDGTQNEDAQADEDPQGAV